MVSSQQIPVMDISESGNADQNCIQHGISSSRQDIFPEADFHIGEIRIIFPLRLLLFPQGMPRTRDIRTVQKF